MQDREYLTEEQLQNVQWIGAPQKKQPQKTQNQLHLEQMGFMPGTPEYQEAYRELTGFGKPKDKTPEIRNDPTGVPRYVDTGQEVFPGIQKPKTMSGESAGRYAAVKQALEQDMPVVERLVFNEQGGIADVNLWPSIPWAQKSKQLANAMRRAINASLRMESGAVVSESEIEEAMQYYMPSHADTAETAKQKLSALKTRLQNAKAAIDGESIAETSTVTETPSAPLEEMSIDDLIALRSRLKDGR